ncbi:MAG: PLP-dependent transferase [Bdellovibrionaceae bacterium]|nr:PLP-dependent transferase [Pseudobdellovibrionaceae bacterium]NUM60189.1 PLP-dependent transferase [Pseudobdellovibrionaceae bacterium]
MDLKKISARTKALHGPFQSQAWDFRHHLIPPMTASTTFRLESLERGARGFSNFASPQSANEEPILIYDRLDEPNSLMLEEQLASLHKGELALVFGSGMGAISTLFLAMTQKNQKILSHRTLYGCTYSLLKNWLPRLNIETEFLDFNDELSLQMKIKKTSTRILYFESISNPLLEMIDFEKVVSLVKIENQNRSDENKILIVVDNTFATPWGLRPLEFGVDFVIESLTKNISGFGTEMGGAIITTKKYETPLKVARKDFGAIMTSHSAWHILVYGISTQALRFEKQQENAQAIAQFLYTHDQVESVIYPGLENYQFHNLYKKYLKTPEGKLAPGTMIAFKLKGTEAQTANFINDLAKNSYAITLAVSLGLTKTLIELPGFMTHSALSEEDKKSCAIDSKVIRLSVGLENVHDLIKDLDEAISRNF